MQARREGSQSAEPISLRRQYEVLSLTLIPFFSSFAILPLAFDYITSFVSFTSVSTHGFSLSYSLNSLIASLPYVPQVALNARPAKEPP